MSSNKPDLYRLYLANLEQHQVFKRAFALALIILGLVDLFYVLLVGGSLSGIYLLIILLLLVYFVLGDIITGLITFKEPEVIIRRVASQKLREPEASDAGGLAGYAFKKLRNGNIVECREALKHFFQLPEVAPSIVRFSRMVQADMERMEGNLDSGARIIKNQVLKKKGPNSITMLVYGRVLLEQGNFLKAAEALTQSQDFFLAKIYGVPNLYKRRFKNGEFRRVIREALAVFVPYYLAKAYWAVGKEQEAGKNLHRALSLCRNKHLRELMKIDFNVSENK